MPAAAGHGAPPGRRPGRGTRRLPAPVAVAPTSPRSTPPVVAAPDRRDRRSRITEVLEQVGLDPGDRRPVRTYSLGMRQRLGLAAALLRTAAAAGARRADQRTRPAGHPRDPRAAARPQRRGHHDLPVQPPARRDRADVHAGRRARPRPAGRCRSSSTRSPRPTGRDPRAHPRRTAGDRAPRRPRARPRRRPRGGRPRHRRRRAQRLAGRRPAYASRRSVRYDGCSRTSCSRPAEGIR